MSNYSFPPETLPGKVRGSGVLTHAVKWSKRAERNTVAKALSKSNLSICVESVGKWEQDDTLVVCHAAKL